MKVDTEISLGPSHIVLDGDPAPRTKMGHSPSQFSAHVHCGHVWINMPLGMEVGLVPGDIVLDGDQAPRPQRGIAPFFFGPCLL